MFTYLYTICFLRPSQDQQVIPSSSTRSVEASNSPRPTTLSFVPTRTPSYPTTSSETGLDLASFRIASSGSWKGVSRSSNLDASTDLSFFPFLFDIIQVSPSSMGSNSSRDWEPWRSSSSWRRLVSLPLFPPRRRRFVAFVVESPRFPSFAPVLFSSLFFFTLPSS